jgi:esterase/lipase
MIIFRAKYKGILTEFAFLEGAKPTHAVIMCEGLPVVPKRQEAIEFLAKRGYFVFYPRYRGTWESDGEFLNQNPVEDIGLLVELINSGEITELYNNKTFTFDIKKISVIGTSFGGSIALEAAGIENVNKVVALSPVVDYKKFNTLYPEEDLKHTGEFMDKAFSNGYRFSKENWQKMLDGLVIDPSLVMTDKNTKKIMVLQCEDDASVNYIPVAEFVKKYNLAYKQLATGGHFSFSKINVQNWELILDWLK